MTLPDGERCSCPMQSHVVCSLVSTFFWLETLSLIKILGHTGPSVSAEVLALPRHARCVLSRLRCYGHSLPLNSYLSRISRIENPSCSACGHPSQDISRLILYCPATRTLRRSLWSRPLVVRLWSSMISAMPLSSGRVRVTTVSQFGELVLFSIKCEAGT